jgi:2'-5' RNA ligase
MEKVQLQLKQSNADVRWEAITKLHATIKFLGDVQENVLPAVLTSIKTNIEKHSQFQLTYEGLGCFPNKKRPRVVWIGCKNDDGTLDKLKTALDDSLLPFGFEAEKRNFQPHVTLGRIKSFNRIKNLISLIEKVTFEPHSFTVKSITVMRSILTPQGSEYSTLGEYHLQG